LRSASRILTIFACPERLGKNSGQVKLLGLLDLLSIHDPFWMMMRHGRSRPLEIEIARRQWMVAVHRKHEVGGAIAIYIAFDDPQPARLKGAELAGLER
jgi:hypothetical protein